MSAFAADGAVAFVAVAALMIEREQVLSMARPVRRK